MIEKPSAKSVKMVLLGNVALYNRNNDAALVSCIFCSAEAQFA